MVIKLISKNYLKICRLSTQGKICRLPTQGKICRLPTQGKKFSFLELHFLLKKSLSTVNIKQMTK